MKKTIIFFTLLFLITSFISAFAKEKTFVKEYTYQAGDVDSKISSVIFENIISPIYSNKMT